MSDVRLYFLAHLLTAKHKHKLFTQTPGSRELEKIEVLFFALVLGLEELNVFCLVGRMS